MSLLSQHEKLKTIIAHADEFIIANAPRLLPNKRSKLVDLCTVSLMQFEDALFHWNQLRNIVQERLCLFETGKTMWFVNLDNSTSTVIQLEHSQTHETREMYVTEILLSALINVIQSPCPAT
jgi:hypothetical protein